MLSIDSIEFKGFKLDKMRQIAAKNVPSAPYTQPIQPFFENYQGEIHHDISLGIGMHLLWTN
jgi:hypothetical protein